MLFAMLDWNKPNGSEEKDETEKFLDRWTEDGRPDIRKVYLSF